MREPLERAGVLDKLRRTAQAAEAGRGSVALVTGEAGIGKTSVVRAFTAGLRMRVLAGACDDLLTPRPLGPLRDMAAAGTPLAKAVADGELERIFDAALAELSTPTVLVVEDLHWADDVTLDVLGYLARRVASLPALLLLTFRDEEAPLRWLGTLAAAPTHRLPLAPLSPAAVETLAEEAGRDAPDLHALTGGNPFYVTEWLYLGNGVPVTVADVVLARVARLEPAARAALEQLAVLPGVTEYDLAERLVGPLDVVAEAERKGLLEARPDGLAFRHELTRRAVYEHVPELRRRSLHASALVKLPTSNPARLVHHAVCADAPAAVLAYAPRAGREAAAAGAHREALAHFTAAMRHEHRLHGDERARLHDDHAWELYNAHRFTEAVVAGERAVALYTDPVALAQAQVRLSRHYYMAGDTEAAERTARQADEGLAGTAAHAYAATYHGAVLALAGDRAAQSAVDRALRLSRAANRVDLVELGLNYLSTAQPGLEADGRIALLRESLALALHHGHHEHAARAYTNLGELLYRHARFDELARVLADGLAFTRDRGFSSHAYNLQVHEALLTMRRGDLTGSLAALAELATRPEDTGMQRVYAEPQHARLLARTGDEAAGTLLLAAWERGQRQRSLVGLGYPGAALAEWAWLTGNAPVAAAVRDAWAQHAGRPGAEPLWAEVLRYCRRAGLPVRSFAGCPEPWASGLRGDWRTAAEGWALLGDPYEQALELADSGEPGPTRDALLMLQDMGATAAAAHARRRLRDMGVRSVPRGPQRTTRAHPAGLTARQADVLELLAAGLTNAQIAEKLVLSVRTVDHHVSAILTKLGVASRQDAAAYHACA
ncbi:ATP-binding protein [Actinophytocola sp.]|uniref:ATP-binding protein n=1 Tax=Actinophytocola sp. TaxID=1872138 RepID=UPI002ED2037C